MKGILGRKIGMTQVFTTDGVLIRKEDWDDSYTPKNLYVSDGLRKVRLALEWCNENNCNAFVASRDCYGDGVSVIDACSNHDESTEDAHEAIHGEEGEKGNALLVWYVCVTDFQRQYCVWMKHLAELVAHHLKEHDTSN